MEVPNSNSDVYPDAGSAGGERRYPLEFTATAGEYFRIWIVNLALTIITLGIYSAWAKVRKKRYFYGHTKIDGEGFEYRANPIAILKGRIIAVGLLAIYTLTGRFETDLHYVLMAVLLFAIPWLVVRSFAFNAHNTAHRNIRLRFDGTYGGTFRIVAVPGVLVILAAAPLYFGRFHPDMLKTLVNLALLPMLGIGILYPLIKARLVKFVLGHHYYGATQFKMELSEYAFYKVFFAAVGIGFLLIILAGVLFGVVAAITTGATKGAAAGAHPVIGMAIFFVLIVIYGGYLLLFTYWSVRTTNLMWGAVGIGPIRLESTLRARELAWLYLSNIVAVIFTLGLATPWAVVRTMRYRAAKMMLITTGELSGFITAESAQVSAVGEEVGEMFDIDIGL